MQILYTNKVSVIGRAQKSRTASIGAYPQFSQYDFSTILCIVLAERFVKNSIQKHGIGQRTNSC
jgi:hypothetical protein